MRCTNAWTNWASNLSGSGTKPSRHISSWPSNNRRGEKNFVQWLWSTKGAGKNSARGQSVIALKALEILSRTKENHREPKLLVGAASYHLTKCAVLQSRRGRSF